MGDRLVTRSISLGHDVTPDEDRLYVSQDTPFMFGPGRQVEVLSDASVGEDGRFEVEYQPAYVNRQRFFEPMDESPPDPHRFNVTNRYYSEEYRLKSYHGQWLDSYHVRPDALARDGFIYVGPGDRVKCVFCLKSLHAWEKGDNVEKEHRRHYPSCPFVRGLCEQQNIPISITQAMERSMGIRFRENADSTDFGCH